MSISLADLYEHKFINCRLINTTFMKEKEGCHLDFEEDNDFLIYLVSFLGSLSVLPGNIISALLMDKIGRIKMIGEWDCGCGVCQVGAQFCKEPGLVLLHMEASRAGSGGDESFPHQMQQESKKTGG